MAARRPQLEREDIFIADLRELVGLTDPVRIVDVGAHPIDGAPPYWQLIKAGTAHVTGFEPQSEGLAQLRAGAGEYETYLPYVIGDGRPAQFRVCQYPGWTSTLQPNSQMLDVFHAYRENARVVSTVKTETTRLDDVAELLGVDFLKIDIQGGELRAMEHGRALLAGAVAVQVEVSFAELYEGSPLFRDIDAFMAELGFNLHTLIDLKTAMISPMIDSHDRFRGLNQLIQADAVYVRDFCKLGLLSAHSLKSLVVLSAGVFGSFDLGARALQELVKRAELADCSLERYLQLVVKLS